MQRRQVAWSAAPARPARKAVGRDRRPPALFLELWALDALCGLLAAFRSHGFLDPAGWCRSCRGFLLVRTGAASSTFLWHE